MSCAIAALHSLRELSFSGHPCECIHCQNECDCDGAPFDADELGVDPEEEFDG